MSCSAAASAGGSTGGTSTPISSAGRDSGSCATCANSPSELPSTSTASVLRADNAPSCSCLASSQIALPSSVSAPVVSSGNGSSTPLGFASVTSTGCCGQSSGAGEDWSKLVSTGSCLGLVSTAAMYSGVAGCSGFLAWAAAAAAGRAGAMRRRLLLDAVSWAICCRSDGVLRQWCGTFGPGQLGHSMAGPMRSAPRVLF
mmetsp:Transcript_61478/g.138534  ORF Transcript_61478/g.138534 Transcript_61478/m.138534 type:complete len:200 (-) Transcript_61478:18-617(-)